MLTIEKAFGLMQGRSWSGVAKGKFIVVEKAFGLGQGKLLSLLSDKDSLFFKTSFFQRVTLASMVFATTVRNRSLPVPMEHIWRVQ